MHNSNLNKIMGFVVLHYITYNDTKNCVDSILQCDCMKKVIIVDNGSLNHTYEKLLEVYHNEKDVTILRNEKNLGFANGNNIGINYLRNIEQCDFITVLNNDTIILQKDFRKLVELEYQRSYFAVLGPKIIDTSGAFDSSPIKSNVYTTHEVSILIFKRQIKYLLCKFHLDGLVNEVGKYKKNSIFDYSKRYLDVQLHGACLIFSNKYFEKYDGFDDSTFLYFEEDILFKRILDSGMSIVYCPVIEIKHLEDSSTNAVNRSSRNKKLFVFKNEIKSLKILKRIVGKSQ